MSMCLGIFSRYDLVDENLGDIKVYTHSHVSWIGTLFYVSDSSLFILFGATLRRVWWMLVSLRGCHDVCSLFRLTITAGRCSWTRWVWTRRWRWRARAVWRADTAGTHTSRSSPTLLMLVRPHTHTRARTHTCYSTSRRRNDLHITLFFTARAVQSRVWRGQPAAVWRGRPHLQAGNYMWDIQYIIERNISKFYIDYFTLWWWRTECNTEYLDALYILM